MALDADVNVNFYPWGAADTATLTWATAASAYGAVLPTGMAEVQPCGP